MVTTTANSSTLIEKIFNNTHLAIAILDKDFNFIKVNEQYAKTDNRSVDEFPGVNLFTYYPNDEAEAIFKSVVRTKQSYQIRGRPLIYPKQRGITYWDWILEPVLDEQGEVELLILILVDVTEQRQKEIELESFYELSHDLLCILDDNLVIKNINRAFNTTLGYTKNQVIGTNALEYVHPADTISTKKVIRRLLRQNISTNIIAIRLRCADGSYKWIEWTHVLIPEKRVIYAIGRDITARKQMEDEVERAYTQIKNMLECISDGFYSLDNDWNFTYLNKFVRVTFPGILIGKNIWENYPKLKDTIFYEKYYEAKLTGKPVRFEGFAPYSNKWFKVNVYPSPEGLSVYFFDITARKKDEERKDLELKRLTLLINSLPQLVFLLAPDYSIRLANDKFKEIFGEKLDKPCYGIFFDRDEPCEECPTLKVFREQTPIYWECTLSNGMYFGVYENLFYDLNGEPLAIKIGVDLTEKKHTERELARLDRLDLIGKLAAGIGHEVRNPMTTVRGFLQMLSQKPKFAEEKKYFDIMVNELDRANSIITEFLSLARNKPSDLEINNLNLIIEEMYPLIQADALNSNINLSLKVNTVPDIFLNKREIRQLILNLVKNGMEAMPKGGTVLIKTFTTEEQVVLAICDEGPGIDNAILDKLGTPFFTTKENGTGLGLATCYNIAERNNAKIDVETGPSGTTFYVKFNKLN